MFRTYFLLVLLGALLHIDSFSQKIKSDYMKSRFTQYPVYALPEQLKTIQAVFVNKNKNPNITDQLLNDFKKSNFIFDSLQVMDGGGIVVEFTISEENVVPNGDFLTYSYDNLYVVKNRVGKMMRKGSVADDPFSAYTTLRPLGHDLKAYKRNLEREFRALVDTIRFYYDFSTPEKKINMIRIKGGASDEFSKTNDYVEGFLKKNVLKTPYLGASDSLRSAIAYYSKLSSSMDKSKEGDLPFIFASSANLSTLYTLLEQYEQAEKQIEIIKSLDYKSEMVKDFENFLLQRKRNKEGYYNSVGKEDFYLVDNRYSKCFYIDTLGRRFSSSIENYVTQLKNGEVFFVNENSPNVIEERGNKKTLKYVYVDGILFKSIPFIKGDQIYGAYMIETTTHDFESAFRVVLYESPTVCFMVDLDSETLFLNNKKLNTWSITSCPRKDQLIVKKDISKFFNHSFSDCPQLAEMMDGGKLDFKTKKIEEFLRVIEEYETLCGSGKYHEMVKQHTPEELNKKLDLTE